MTTSQDEEHARRDEGAARPSGPVESDTLSQDEEEMTRRKRFLMREPGTPEDEDQSEL